MDYSLLVVIGVEKSEGEERMEDGQEVKCVYFENKCVLFGVIDYL